MEEEIKMKSRPVNGQHDIERMSVGSERPDGRLDVDEKKNKHLRFPWQDEYNPAPEDETDSGDTDHYYNIQCRSR